MWWCGFCGEDCDDDAEHVCPDRAVELGGIETLIGPSAEVEA